jgi:hypothetical protein
MVVALRRFVKHFGFAGGNRRYFPAHHTSSLANVLRVTLTVVWRQARSERTAFSVYCVDEPVQEDFYAFSVKNFSFPACVDTCPGIDSDRGHVSRWQRCR